MKKILKKLYFESELGYLFLYVPKKVYDIIRNHKNNKLSDKEFIDQQYKKIFSRQINWKSPSLFTEKIQWLKLNDRKELYTLCADKYAVRDYVKEKIGEQYLIPLVFLTEDYSNIDKENLPDYPVIVKTTHDSGGTFVINDKSEIDFAKIQRKLKIRLKNNFYYFHREWEYKNIKPRIIVEKLIKDYSNNEVLNDYKIHCFNGIPLYIQTIFDRKSEVKEDWYDVDWNLVDVYYFSQLKKYVPKPKLLDELLIIAKKLSQDFPYVRVDLYISNNRVYFGELTFRPYGGWMHFQPSEFDFYLGQKLDITNLKKDGKCL